MATILCVLAQATADEWLDRLETRLLEARRIRVEAHVNSGGVESDVHVWFAAPDRMTYVQVLPGQRQELRVEGSRAARLQNARVQWLPAEQAPDAAWTPLLLARWGASGLSQRATGDVPEPSGAQLREEEGRIVLEYRWGEGGDWTVELALDRETGLPVRRSSAHGGGHAYAEEYSVFEVDGELPEGSVGIPEDFGWPARVEAHPWMPEAPPVTLDLEGASLALACAELMEQTGWTFGIPAEATRARVSIRCEAASAVEALVALERQVPGFALEGRESERARRAYWTAVRQRSGGPRLEEADVRWVARESAARWPASAAGPFVVRLDRVRVMRRISPATGDGAALLLGLRAAPIGGAKALDIRFRSVQAVFQDGAEVAAQLDENPVEPQSDRLAALRASRTPSVSEVAVALPRHPFSRLDRIEGLLVATVPAVIIQERAGPSEEPQVWEREGVRVEVSPLQAAGGQVNVRVEVRSQEPLARGIGFPGSVRVLDEQGEALDGGVQSTSLGGDHASVEGRWTLSEGRTLGVVEVEVYGGQRRVEFPFEVPDVGVGWE